METPITGNSLARSPRLGIVVADGEFAATLNEFADTLAARGWAVAREPDRGPDSLAAADIAIVRDDGGLPPDLAADPITRPIPRWLLSTPAESLAALWDRCAAAGLRPEILPPRRGDLWCWWGSAPLVTELQRAVPECAVRRVVIGVNWVLVEGPEGVGLAHAPPRDAPGCRPLGDAGRFAEPSLAELARYVHADNPFTRAIGWAAINAHWNSAARLPGGDRRNGLAALASRQDNPAQKPLGVRDTVIIGRFPGVRDLMPNAAIVERAPTTDEYPETAAPELLRVATRVGITASTLGNGTFPALLDATRRGPRRTTTALIGPGTPMAPILHAYGLQILSGFVVTDAEAAATVVAQGGAVRQLKACGETHTLDCGSEEAS